MRAVVLGLALLVLSAARVEAAPVQPRIYHRNPQECADGKLNALFMADWWYDLNAAQAERRIDDAQRQAIEKRMMELVMELGAHNKDNNPALLVAFCQKLNLLRPHWSQW